MGFSVRLQNVLFNRSGRNWLLSTREDICCHLFPSTLVSDGDNDVPLRAKVTALGDGVW